MVQVVDGLAAGDAVVTSGQFLLDAESRMREAIQKHLHERLLVGGGGGTPEPATEPGVATTAPAATSAPVAVAAAAPPSDEADKVFAAYLAIQNVLGAPQKSDKPIDPAELTKAAEALASSAKGELQPAAGAVGAAASALHGQPLSEQRKLYKPLSESVIALARLAPPSESIARDLVIAYCPMAPGEGARWLQPGEAIHNPYFATAMKDCGTVEGKVAAAKAGPR
jgi:Cu(I)/Ag(I) efflux system membrane fusion protein